MLGAVSEDANSTRFGIRPVFKNEPKFLSNSDIRSVYCSHFFRTIAQPMKLAYSDTGE